MKNDMEMEVIETSEYGVILCCHDVEVADKFEDFLTENCYVFFNVRPENTDVFFYFGQASAPAKVEGLYEMFLRESQKESTDIRIQADR